MFFFRLACLCCQYRAVWMDWKEAVCRLGSVPFWIQLQVLVACLIFPTHPIFKSPLNPACPTSSHTRLQFGLSTKQTAYKRCQTATFTHFKIHRTDWQCWVRMSQSSLAVTVNPYLWAYALTSIQHSISLLGLMRNALILASALYIFLTDSRLYLTHSPFLSNHSLLCTKLISTN